MPTSSSVPFSNASRLHFPGSNRVLDPQKINRVKGGSCGTPLPWDLIPLGQLFLPATWCAATEAPLSVRVFQVLAHSKNCTDPDSYTDLNDVRATSDAFCMFMTIGLFFLSRCSTAQPDFPGRCQGRAGSHTQRRPRSHQYW